MSLLTRERWVELFLAADIDKNGYFKPSYVDGCIIVDGQIDIDKFERAVIAEFMTLSIVAPHNLEKTDEST